MHYLTSTLIGVVHPIHSLLPLPHQGCVMRTTTYSS
jgi:hypothetical protein